TRARTSRSAKTRSVPRPAAPRLAAPADDAPGARPARRLPLHADPRQHHRVPGVQPLGRAPRQPLGGFCPVRAAVRGPRFWHAVGNTLMIATIQLVFFFPIPIALAILLDSVLTPKLRLVLQSIVYMPHFFSWVLVVTLFQQILGGAGLFSQVLRQNGYAPLEVMSNPDAFLFVVTSQMIWKDAGWGTIIFLAALAAINQNLYESAAVDGAGRWRRMWHITLPGLRPVIIL